MSRLMRSPELFGRVSGLGLRLLHALLGAPDYGAYLRHMRLKHPQHIPQARADFFRERQSARYGRGSSRCC